MSDEGGSAAKLWSMASLGTPMAVRVAATLRIADHLDAGRRTAPELAETVGAHPGALDRLLRYLAVRGVLVRDDAGRYALTPLGEPLREDHPAGIRAWFDIEGAGRGELSFVELLHSVRTGEAAFPVRYGREYWEDLTAEPGRAASFNKLLGEDVAVRAPGVVAGFDWAALGHVVDVGGGDGSLLASLLAANPALRGTVVDLPDAAQAAKERFAASGLGERADAVAGSFFDPLPAGAGGYVLSLVLHDWDDESAVAILRRCAEAAGEGGSVLVIESIGATGDAPHTGMDLRMLCVYGAKERGVAEFSALAAAAGLDVAAVHPAGPSAIIELTVAR
ncbi:methyltransferase [Streptomyces sp. ICN441]|uniref:Methyltransferase n=1 Tax=Streptomyces tirandamycinicus TaxID=2174846 RepID=A0A2S1T2C0_9ACTN|nr:MULTISPECIES: methyltransferase [Streptomyces]AWI32805.1 methyltransferase [Streptomyces tirandamycinicus]TFE38870.1 methyltransferase [Streptomyces sp. ICN441]